jgi:hypothetical protein
MTENTKKPPIVDTSESSCYMYKISMVVQVIAPNKEIANMKLEQEGGYVSRRDVEFVRSIVLYKHAEDDETEDD